MTIQTSFYFSAREEEVDDVKRMDAYKPGGYHPLGYGSSSTVWLANDDAANRFVALKIVAADRTENNGEPALLKWLHTKPLDHMGASHVIQVHDYFQIQGPNGTHQVIVMDVLGSFHPLRTDTNILKQQSRSVCYQLLSGLAYLQQEKVVHSDLHFGNTGFKTPDRYTDSDERMLSFPIITAVVPRDHSEQSDSPPKYIVSAHPITAEIMFERFVDKPNVQLSAEIMGFWNGALPSLDKGPVPETSSVARAPELTFNKLSHGQVQEWGVSSDVWLMAFTIYEIGFAAEMFPDGACHDARLIYETMKLVGPLPERWKPYWDPKPFEDSNDPDAAWRKIRDAYQLGVENIDALLDLLRVMLRWDTAERPTAADLLKYPWFAT
ncbi:kinase-like domain-containing protein [Suillus ampliporus]|nr:kinase-like domain-containing protein [Suillus ampliporus]